MGSRQLILCHLHAAGFRDARGWVCARSPPHDSVGKEHTRLLRVLFGLLDFLCEAPAKHHIPRRVRPATPHGFPVGVLRHLRHDLLRCHGRADAHAGVLNVHSIDGRRGISDSCRECLGKWALPGPVPRQISRGLLVPRLCWQRRGAPGRGDRRAGRELDTRPAYHAAGAGALWRVRLRAGAAQPGPRRRFPQRRRGRARRGPERRAGPRGEGRE
mmetsp:Transcript_28759/g.82270  ORF Transcript_28759/g.82270 Transcript_28759/m.82270 type:complete len:215 (+) Transcript_28759:25-669(+)